MGQMQKISFARALLSSPDLLILDEATSNLDRESKILIHEILKTKKCTIINSTHNIEDISYYDFHIIIEEKNNLRNVRYV
jgi:ABC-type bacteriocin/lantibiotic exporter with double-glycine peptidase domain